MGDTITDTSKVAGTSKVTGTGVANTTRVLAGSGALPAGGKQPSTPPAPFTTKADVLVWANDLVHQDFGLPGTFVHWLPSPLHPKHTPAHLPHRDLAGSTFFAWTNAGTEIFLVDSAWTALQTLTTAPTQRVYLWVALFHESKHARGFTSKWKGAHPPTFKDMFAHEKKTYESTATDMASPPGQRIKAILADQDAKDIFVDVRKQQRAEVTKMADWLKAHKSQLDKASADAQEDLYYSHFAPDLPSALTNAIPPLKPAQVITKTYGY